MPLSPHTPPGTHVVVTWLEATEADVLSTVTPKYRAFVRDNFHLVKAAAGLFKLGERFVLSRICECDFAVDGFHCHLVGVDGCYSLKHFDVASLPKSITDLLVSKPVDEVV